MKWQFNSFTQTDLGLVQKLLYTTTPRLGVNFDENMVLDFKCVNDSDKNNKCKNYN